MVMARKRRYAGFVRMWRQWTLPAGLSLDNFRQLFTSLGSRISMLIVFFSYLYMDMDLERRVSNIFFLRQPSTLAQAPLPSLQLLVSPHIRLAVRTRFSLLARCTTSEHIVDLGTESK